MAVGVSERLSRESFACSWLRALSPRQLLAALFIGGGDDLFLLNALERHE
jgi:hypothetical protein